MAIREYVLVALAVCQFNVAINKMDERTGKWSYTSFDKIVQEMPAFAKNLFGYTAVRRLPSSLSDLGFKGASMLG